MNTGAQEGMGVGKRELPSNLGTALKEVKGEDREGGSGAINVKA